MWLPRAPPAWWVRDPLTEALHNWTARRRCPPVWFICHSPVCHSLSFTTVTTSHSRQVGFLCRSKVNLSNHCCSFTPLQEPGRGRVRGGGRQEVSDHACFSQQGRVTARTPAAAGEPGERTHLQQQWVVMGTWVEERHPEYESLWAGNQPAPYQDFTEGLWERWCI